jgi:hypothetical protein
MATKDGSSDGRRDVLTALPRTRPTRRSVKRGGARPGATTNPPSKGASEATAVGGRKRPQRAGATAKSTRAQPAVAEPRPRVPPAGYATPRADDAGAPLPRGELVATAVEAVGELAQVGLTVGLQGLRSALRRLPRP